MVPEQLYKTNPILEAKQAKVLVLKFLFGNCVLFQVNVKLSLNNPNIVMNGVIVSS